MRNNWEPGSLHRRDLLKAGAAASLAFSPLAARADGTPPPYTVSINVEIMFPRSMPRARRIEAVAAQGFKYYSFWSASEQEQAEMLEAQKRLGMKCVSIVGTGPAGRQSGFTEPGKEEILLNEISERIAISKKFGGPDLITFVGRIQKDVPWEQQRSQIVSGLRKAGDLAKAAGVTIAVEPLADGNGSMALHTTGEAFPVIDEVAHPNVKICFDLYHLQQTEGNLTRNLKLGLKNNWIKLVQIGEVPGRLEPGTGEIDFGFVLKTLREVGYSGFVDTEMGTSSTPEHAMDVARKLAEES